MLILCLRFINKIPVNYRANTNDDFFYKNYML